MHVNTGKSRIITDSEKVKILEGRVEQLTQKVADLEKKSAPAPKPAEGKPIAK